MLLGEDIISSISSNNHGTLWNNSDVVYITLDLRKIHQCCMSQVQFYSPENVWLRDERCEKQKEYWEKYKYEIRGLI